MDNSEITTNYYGETIGRLLSNHKGLGSTMSTDSGSTEIFVGANKLLEDIRFEISTPKGSMLTMPEYGCNIYKYRYNALNQVTYDEIYDEMVKVLSSFSGIYISSVTVDGDNNNNTIKIQYKIIYNNKELTDTVTLDVES